MCFMTKCPYVPPHAFNVDFPHLMLRHRAVEARKHGIGLRRERSSPRPTATASSARSVAPLANWATRRAQHSRPVRIAGEGRRHRPRGRAAEHSSGTTFEQRAPSRAGRDQRERARLRHARRCSTPPASSTTTARHRRGGPRACSPGTASRPRSCYPRLLRHAPARAGRSRRGRRRGAAGRRAALLPLDRRGLRHRRADAVLRADAEVRMAADPARAIRRRAARARRPTTSAEYVVDIAKKHGLAPGLQPLEGGVSRAPRLPRARAEHGRQGGRDAAPDPRDARSR